MKLLLWLMRWSWSAGISWGSVVIPGCISVTWDRGFFDIHFYFLFVNFGFVYRDPTKIHYYEAYEAHETNDNITDNPTEIDGYK